MLKLELHEEIHSVTCLYGEVLKGAYRRDQLQIVQVYQHACDLRRPFSSNDLLNVLKNGVANQILAGLDISSSSLKLVRLKKVLYLVEVLD